MIVCICKAVRERDLRDAVARGARSLEDLARLTAAGTDCGSCQPALEELLSGELDRLRRQAPDSGPSV